MILNGIHLDDLYAKAKIAFDECIANQKAELSGELGVSISLIRTRNDWVSVKFCGSDERSYTVETRLLLYLHDDDPIGWYCYHENESGEVVDDFLVFK